MNLRTVIYRVEKMDIINKELLVPLKYMKVIDGRICLTVHRNWLNNLLTVGPISFINHERLSEDEIAARPVLEELGSDWIRVYVKIYEKQHKSAVPLPRGRHTTNGNAQADLTFSQLLHYVVETNYRNLWKECYKKYYNPWNCVEHKDHCNIAANISDTSIMQEVLQKAYGCTLVQIQNGMVISVSPGIPTEVHCNLLPMLLALETTSAFITLYEQTAEYSLRECVMFSPAALNMTHAKPLFLIYQLLQLYRDLHDRGLLLGEVTLSDILLMDNFTIQVLPKLSDNIYIKPKTELHTVSTSQETKNKHFTCYKKNINATSSTISQQNSEFGMNESIEKLCEMWVYNCISNYDYLTAINNLAGRRYGDPSCHHVMPWVTDFTSRCGGNWRDLTKSKFRLNKGDRQLDLTFDSQSVEVGHHVSDVLSEITYYVYLSRRYNKSVLCKYVRPKWVPGEYPASIQRLHDWSPDECIPQFFSDPSVFKSIHEDLPDLEIPVWATSPEDFIEKHREALESFYVSERLHHWIDLTFGYKLSGSAAVKSKNVCLQLVDNHTSLTHSGVVQLFTQPHPQKIIPSPYWCKIPPRLRSSFLISKYKNDQFGNRASDDEGHSSGFEEEELSASAINTSRSSPLVLSRLLSRSRGSLLATEDNTKQDKSINQMITLPKDYNPVAAIMQVETTHMFMNKVSSQIYKPQVELPESNINYKQIVAGGRLKEQQILGCLIVEIFLSSKFKAILNTDKISFTRRVATCLNTLKMSNDSLPKCVRNAVALLLQVNIVPKSYNINNIEVTDMPFRYSTVTHMGLPPPSAHQFLQPILSGSLFPFSKYYKNLFNILEMLQDYNSLVRELDFIMMSEDDMDCLLRTKTRFLCKISECKVKAIAREIEHLLSHNGVAKEVSLELIVPYIQQIMEESYSAVLAVWYLFDPIAKLLGPKDTAETFLSPIMKLYENGSFMDHSLHADMLPTALLAKFKTTRLYHRNFLLKLMVRLGLRRFLENFIAPLVEAVGGCRDYIQGSLTYTCKTGNLKSCNLHEICNEGEGILSPLDEDSSADSEHNIPLSPGPAISDYTYNVNSVNNDIEEVFAMEGEDSSWISLNSGISHDTDLQKDLNLNLNDDLIEEASKISPLRSVKSPIIPIPKTNSPSKSVTELSNICYNVGSKTSNEEFSYDNTYDGIIHSGNMFEEIVGTEEQNCMTVQTDDIKSGTVIHEDVHVDHIYQKSTLNECTTSEMSAGSIIWLSHRLGPVLTARYLSRNLLRMLALCYTGKENLTAIDDTVSWTQSIVWNKKVLIGDRNATKVLDCLAAIAGLYGEQIIVLQYFAHMVELLALCKRKLTQNLEGGLISCLTLLNHVMSYLNDTTLMDVLHEPIVKAILYPTVRILSSTRFTFPNGVIARTVMAEKYLETIFTLSLRLGNVVVKNHLVVLIQRFFLAFDKSFGQNMAENFKSEINQKMMNENFMRTKVSNQDNKDIRGLLSNFNKDVADSYSPPIIENTDVSDLQKNKALEELKAVFTIEFAHKTYTLLNKCIDNEVMEQILKNYEYVHSLCRQYEQEIKITPNTESNKYITSYNSNHNILESAEMIYKETSNFGNISVVGNRFAIQKNDIEDHVLSENIISNSEVNTSAYTGRELRGNWLAYWEHEIGRSDKDIAFNIKQIKLQTFNGHTNSIRCLYVLDNENSFMSGGRDKTVKLWSLRSQGDGNTVSSCQYTYTGHKKSVLALAFLESLRYVVTCDGTIHCWDPFMGSLIGSPENSRPVPVNTLKASPSPCTTLLAGTTDITLRVVDCRTFQYVNEMKVSVNPTGLIRCIAVAPSGYWVALGQASGFLTILDIRTGFIIASWKGHECEILQLEVINETTIVSSSLDETIAVWNVLDGKLKFHLKGSTEPVHCMSTYEQELIIGTTANRVGVYTSIETTASFSSSKLKSDSFKGLLTTMAVLPLNRLLLLGADNGGITLMC